MNELRACIIKKKFEHQKDRQGYFHGFYSVGNINEGIDPCFIFEDLDGNCKLLYNINDLKFTDKAGA